MIPQHIAAAIYDAYHSYMDDVPRTNIVYQGLCYQDQLVGAIMWRHPLIRTLHSDDIPSQGDEFLGFVAS